MERYLMFSMILMYSALSVLLVVFAISYIWDMYQEHQTRKKRKAGHFKMPHYEPPKKE